MFSRIPIARFILTRIRFALFALCVALLAPAAGAQVIDDNIRVAQADYDNRPATRGDFRRLEGLIGQMNSRLDLLEARMGNLEARMDMLESRIDRVGSRMDRVENALQMQTQQINNIYNILLAGFAAIVAGLLGVIAVLLPRRGSAPNTAATPKADGLKTA